MTTILLVEDNELNRDMLLRRLQRRGFQVVVAVDGQQGIDLACTLKPDLILMDISLPLVDGWTATQQIRNEPTLTHTPIIALTAHALAGDRDRSIAAGCSDYETKPIDFARLLTKITTLLESSKSL